MTAGIERIVVTLDAASENRTAIETAARLAARAKAPLHGVFVEDEDLLHLAALPFSRQVTLAAGVEDLTAEQLELHLRAAAERARTELAAAARRHRVNWSFEIVRGRSAAALAYASASDLVVAGALTRPIGGQFRVQCRWWSSVELSPGPFLLARREWSGSGTVVLLRDRSAAAARLLQAAAQVAQAADGTLTVVCPPAVAKPGLERWIAEQLAGQPVQLQVEVAPDEPAALQRRIGELGCHLLAIEATEVAGPGDRLRELGERFACDLLIVR
jgi:nucleotide-binding universal stress UspA family protein